MFEWYLYDQHYPIPSPEERILDVLKIFHPSKFSYLSERETRDIISTIVYNTKVESISLYNLLTKKKIITESLNNLDFYNKKSKLKYLHAKAVLSRFVRVWMHYYYLPNGKGFKIAKNHYYSIK